MIEMTLATPLSTAFTLALLVGLAIVALPAERAEAKKGEATADAKIADVTLLREEEKLARDVYLTLHKRWGLQIFDNISRSEQRHMDRMQSLLASYGAPDPVKSDEVGAFTNPELAALYKKLTRQGEKSEKEALLVGATIEDLDIRDITAMKKRTSASEALDAFDKLLCGSRNHMRAFTRQLAARGVVYEAHYISAAELAAIIEGNHERCGRMGPGQGRGGQGDGTGSHRCGSQCNCDRGN
jgi:hypothetical protein